jgi:hypothetical protein
MGKNFLKIPVVIALTLCLPLTGLGFVYTPCACSGHHKPNPISEPLQKSADHPGCCQQEAQPESSRPCQCGDHSCDVALETKESGLIPLLADSSVFVEVPEFPGGKSLSSGLFNRPFPFHSPYIFNQEFLYLQIQTLRC